MSKNIDDLRDVLFDTLSKLQTGTIELERAAAIKAVSDTIVNAAKVEVAYIQKAGGKDSSRFLESNKPGALATAQRIEREGLTSLSIAGQMNRVTGTEGVGGA